MSSEPVNREIRVFLSSTFHDMEAERNHLMKQVFPKVRAACQSRQVGFTEIDLRWGVTEKEAKNGATVEICLKEIDRCRDFPPFFIGFLGERYGWIPREEQLAAYWQQHAESPYANPIRQAIRRGISVTELEMELGVLATGAAEKIAGHALFFLRDSRLTDTLYEQDTGQEPNQQDQRYYNPANGKLDTLKERIRRTPYLGMDGYTTVEQFGQGVEDFLFSQLDHYFPEGEIPSPLQRMQAAHAAFRFHRLHNFLSRPDVRAQLLDAMACRIETPALGPILLAGPSGQGKSALLADLARHLEAVPESGTGPVVWRVIDHYVGADEHTSLDSWIKRILETLHPEIEDLTGPIAESPKDRQEALSSWLAFAARRTEQHSDTPERPVRFALILDALDQLSDGGKDLAPLKPEILGPDTVLIVSAADGTPARESAGQFETVEVPPLTNTLKTTLIQDTLQRYRKTLPQDLILRLASAPQTNSPLYLTLALEELRLDARHESLGGLLDEILQSPDAPHLFLHRFLLDEDYGRPENPTLAAVFMAMLGASRNGLTENELADLLALPEDPVSDETGQPRVPQVYLSRLLAAFQPFLLNKQGNRAPMHRILGEAALSYLDEGWLRQVLYVYFRKGYGLDDNQLCLRSATEALYQIKELTKLNHIEHDNFRKVLIVDLGYMHIPALLHDIEPEITYSALNLINESERLSITDRYVNDIDEFDANKFIFFRDLLINLASWFRLIAYDRNVLPRKILQKILDKQEFFYPLEVDQIANTLTQLGLVCEDMGDLVASLGISKRVYTLREQTLGSDHPDTAMSLNNLAESLRGIGNPENFKAAQPLYERALRIFESCHEKDHPDIALVLNNYGCYLMDTGMQEDLSIVRPLLMRALEIRKAILGEQNYLTAQSMMNLACCLESTDHPHDFEEAKKYFKLALRIFESTVGPEHPSTATSLANLARHLKSTGSPEDFAAARPLYERALAIQEKALGLEHPDTAVILNNLIFHLRSTGNPDDLTAARLMERKVNASMRLTKTVVKWLEEEEWKERPKIDEEKQTSSTSFLYKAGDFSLKCWFDVDEELEIFKVYMYFFDTKVPNDKLDETHKFVSAVTDQLLLGNLHLNREERTIRYYNAIDVESATFEPQHITNMFVMAGNAMERWLPKYMAICFGGKTVDEVLAED